MELETRGSYETPLLELRQEGREIIGSFRYGSLATLSDRGRVRKESIDPGAFRFSIEDSAREINLLVGHSFQRPLASRKEGSLILTDSDASLDFRAMMPPENERPSWMRDAALALQSGLMRGISPGFRVPPMSVVPGAEYEQEEPGNPGVFIRRIRSAVLRELSLVTSAAYIDATADLRQDVEETRPKTTEAMIWRLL